MKEARKSAQHLQKAAGHPCAAPPVMVAMTFVLAIVSGALSFASPLVNQHIVMTDCK